MEVEMRTNLDISLIKKQFLCGIPIEKIKFNGQISIEEQREILNKTIKDNLIKKYPIKHVYQQMFMRRLLKKLENDNCEIEDELYEVLCHFLSINDTATMHYRHYLMEGKCGEIDRVIIKESKSIISEGTTGLCSWQAAEALAEWCLINKNEINGKDIVELGSGVGLTGLTVLSTCSPNKYTFTDCHASVLELLKENIELNSSTLRNNKLRNVEVDVIDFAWELADQFIDASWASPNLILAADVVYDMSTFRSLITAVKTLLNRANSYAIIAITVRNESTVCNFITQLGTYGLLHEEDRVSNYSIFFPPTDVPVKILRIYK